MEFVEKLFQALENDNLKEFSSCMEQSNCGPLRLGRFPVLSVMYMYNSRRLLHVYEKRFLKHNSWKDVGEPMELAAKFRSVAGKCLRFYLNETVSPVEMLLLINRDARLKRVFAQAHVTPPVKQRLTNIYYVKWGLQAQFVRNTVVLQRRPLTRAEKLQWLMRAVCILLCVALLAGMPFALNAISPFIEDNSVLNVTHWWQIRFKSDKTYSLANDVTVSQGFFAENMNCKLIGNGHTVTVQGGSLFGTVNGTLEDIIFETDGSPLAEKVALGATVDNVTVNATVDMETDKAIGFVAVNNYGAITNTVLNAKGKLSAIVAEQESDEEEQTEIQTLYCGGIVANNNKTTVGGKAYYASVQNCVANFDVLTLQGQAQVDAAFGGIVGRNAAFVEDCQTNGAFSADTFDLAGICAENNYLLRGNINNANITQHTDVDEWSPIAAGIVLINYYVVDNCQNNGAISSQSTATTVQENFPVAHAAGIAYESIPLDAHSTSYVQYCENNGAVSANGSNIVEAAGIVNFSFGRVLLSVNNGEISSQGQREARAGGIVSTFSMVVSECLSTGTIEAAGNVCYAGGIWGYFMNYSETYEGHSWLYNGTVVNCIASCEIKVTKSSSTTFAAVGGIVAYVDEKVATIYGTEESQYFGGAVISCYFTGNLQTNADYVGAIVGVVGNNIYLATVADAENGNFSGNVYVATGGALTAFGAAFNDSVYKAVSDVGANKASAAEIENDAAYKEILEHLGITNK